MELDTNLIATIAASALALMMGWFGLSHCGGADQGQGA
jgi:hypothetical protein